MEKIHAVIHYIIDSFQQADSISKLGKVKLAKILWFADREFMYEYHKSITGIQYVKLANGPVPKKYDMILSEMKEEGIIHQYQINKFGKPQQCFISLKKPSLEVFSKEEIKVLDNIIYELKNKSATKLSDVTHDSLWENREVGEVMPIESVFCRDIVEPNEDDIAWAKSKIFKA